MRVDKRRWAGPAVAVLMGGSLAACANESASDADAQTTLTVYAASSLRGAFEVLAEDFEADHPSVSVAFNFAGSSDLVAQIQQGAPADVFASADTANMDKLVADKLTGAAPRKFASNTLEIAVPAGNPGQVTGLADLAEPGVTLVVCAAEVPCGKAAAKVAAASGLHLAPVSEEQSVADVMNKVVAGEADAGLVYVTDVKAAADAVDGIAFAESASAVNVYPIATVKGSDEAALAAAFAELVLSAAGQQVLADFGFGRG